MKCLPLFLLIATLQTMSTHAQSHGIVGQVAPSLGVQEWINLPEGTTTLDVGELEGQVVYLYCFQSWCPGCHSSGFPTLKAVHEHFSRDTNVTFLVVQTTFEGAHVNTFQRARKIADTYDLTMPVGQSGGKDKRSRLMAAYRTRGTPWTIIIDRHGVVRFNDFHIQPEKAIRLITSLKAEPLNQGQDRPQPR